MFVVVDLIRTKNPVLQIYECFIRLACFAQGSTFTAKGLHTVQNWGWDRELCLVFIVICKSLCIPGKFAYLLCCGYEVYNLYSKHTSAHLMLND